MEDTKFWLRVWALLTLVLIVGMLCVTFSKYNNRDKWDKAVANGADPMVAACALGISGTRSDTADAIICNTLAHNRK
jgi:hypothetical protein